MQKENSGPCLSAVFVDYDNIYLSLKRKNEDAAKRFAKEAPTWIRAIENGQLITATNGLIAESRRRIVMNRCYGNPVPRRNTHDNSTDMNSFPFVRHHFLRAGFEVVDCPPLTAQLKNSSDIRMVMDMRDYLLHDTYFDEFVILSGDADFTPVLHRLRQHARRTVIYANDYTAAPYTAICDGEVRENDLLAMLLDSRITVQTESNDAAPGTSQHATPLQAVAQPAPAAPAPSPARLEDLRAGIIAEVVAGVRAAAAPVPLEALADRALRAVGHERTIGTSWAGAGSFRELLRQNLPAEIALTDQAPYFAYDPKRHGIQQPAALEAPRNERGRAPAASPDMFEPRLAAPLQPPMTGHGERATAPAHARAAPAQDNRFDYRPEPIHAEPTRAAPAAAPPTARPQVPPERPAARSQPALPARQEPAPRAETSTAIQQSIARIHEACQAPALAPAEYRVLFEVMAQEINDNGLTGAQTLSSILQRAKDRGLELTRDEVRFALEIVSETDPWFEQGASANLFAGRFRNFVVARCRAQGVNLSAGELDLVDALFAGGPMPQLGEGRKPAHAQIAAPATPATAAQPEARNGAGRWWSLDDGRAAKDDPSEPITPASTEEADDFPRIVRTRLRG